MTEPSDEQLAKWLALFTDDKDNEWAAIQRDEAEVIIQAIQAARKRIAELEKQS